MLSLTQGHLKQLEFCPRRYQYTYRDRYTPPTAPAHLAGQEWGTQFHQVMQQRELGLPVDRLLGQNADLGTAVAGLMAAAPDLFSPDLFAPDSASFRQSEHRRTLEFNGYLLTAIYDLLVLTPERGHIVDWKTYQRPLGQPQLAQDWQTRLYLYLLVETTALPPDRAVMTYWFVPPPAAEATAPSSIELAYSAAQHRRTASDLQRLTDRLTELLASGDDLPQVDPSTGRCDRCPFAVRCQRGAEGYGAVALPAIADIAEVPL